ncbi:hypothetical protein H072_871 [Dactylellina haptotyla CBS 200.50]|uniref:F-box domain-containing protein n=1 Tax=Dactylellina haptotyla (strain CBS 200.50) TaxID=1284197 RepID=S8AVW9_DACHA|nr:hypothetical protein H072_871 [Dactylellina haptotyla CBS 200.50]
MLQRALQKLQLSRGDHSKVPSPSIVSAPEPPSTTSTDPEANSSPPPFFSLSIDILALILKYLKFRDLVAISLTAKGLRHLCPPITQSPASKLEARCLHRLNRRLLPPKLQGQPPTGPIKCPYCSHSLCPPVCSSALLLDSASGVFYPSSLYPLHLATFKYSKFPPSDGTPFTYSTIWCAHHRCPRDLLTQKPPLLTSITSNITPLPQQLHSGPQKFLSEYTNETTFASLNKKQYYLCFQTPSWLIGHKPEYELPARVIRTRRGADISSDMKLAGVKRYGFLDEITKQEDDGDGGTRTVNGWLQPAYERFNYESLCMHCYNPINAPTKSIWALDFTNFCTCDHNVVHDHTADDGGDAEEGSTRANMTRPGCRMCGVANVRYTLVEAFDLVREKVSKTKYVLRQEYYRLFLATECDIYTDMSPYAVEKERIRPINPDRAAQSMDIVRGLSADSLIRPFPKPVYRVGIANLPYPVLRMILVILLEDAESLHAYYQALQASYVFLKAYYRGNVTRKTLEKLQERYTYSRGFSWPAPFPPDPRQVG